MKIIITCHLRFHKPVVILSQTAIYALRATTYLAENQGDGSVRVEDMAEALDVPRNYLSKILNVMARAGILSSTRGPNGGFRFRGDPTETNLARVIAPFDDVSDASACFLGRERCSDASPCAAHARWKGVRSGVLAFLNETTVHDLTPAGASHAPGALPSCA